MSEATQIWGCEATGDRALIVNYHYCVSQESNPYLYRTAVRPDAFEKQIASLAQFNQAAKERATGLRALVTYDDGTADVAADALPVLFRHRVPVILFCCTLPLIERKLLNVTKTHMLQGKLGFEAMRDRFLSLLERVEEPFEMDSPERIGLGHIYRYDQEEVRTFKLLLNVKLPYPVVTNILDRLFEEEFGNQAAAAERIYMSIDVLREAQKQGAVIGLHTHSHPMLGRLTEAQMREEIGTCRDYLTDKLGTVAPVLSYPFGVRGTWNETTKAVMRSLALKSACTLGREVYDPQIHEDPYEVPRFDVNDVFSPDGTIKLPL